LTNGHWWYSNTPSFIHRDAAARLEAVPRNKQIAYYSDAYKLEFVLPKFDMYRRVLSRILAEEFVGENGWSEEKAIELGRQVLRGNVDEIFQSPLVDAESADEVTGPSMAVSLSSDAENDDDENLDLGDGDSELSAFLAADSEDEDGDGFETVGDGSDRTVGTDSYTPGAGTVSELDDTLIGNSAAGDSLDPVPTDDEIEATQLADVLLADSVDKQLEATALDAEIDAVPLDVGDILGYSNENPSGPNAPNSHIQLLAGDGEFTPDGDSMMLEPDPMTGELHFPVDEDDEGDNGSGSGAGKSRE
jgi:hypothetical protein